MIAHQSTETHNITLKNLALFRPKLRDSYSTNQIARFLNYSAIVDLAKYISAGWVPNMICGNQIQLYLKRLSIYILLIHELISRPKTGSNLAI